MACKRITKTNGVNSQLFDDIYNNLTSQDEYEAEKLYSYFESEDFIKDFGDYHNVGNYSDFKGRIDENKEPILQYNELAKKYYYTNSNKEQIFYPLVKRGLRGVFDYKQIDAITSQLALSYFKDNTNVDFNNIEFDENQKLPNLKGYLYSKFKSKIEELDASDDTYLNALLLEDSLEFLNEWVGEVDTFYKRIGINRVDTEGELEGELEVIEAEAKDPAFNKASFEKDTKDAISTNVKLKLSMLVNEGNTDTLWNEDSFVPFNDVYGTLLGGLANQVPVVKNGVLEDIFDIYKDEISKLAEKKPYFNQLLGFLNNPSFTEDNQNEFIQAFRLHKNNFLLTELLQSTYAEQIVNKDGSIKEIIMPELRITVKNVSEAGNKSSRIVSEWGNNFKNKFLNVDNSYKKDSDKDLKIISNNLIKLKTKITSKLTLDEFKNVAEEFAKHLDLLGVDTTEEGIIDYLDERGKNVFDIDKQVTRLSKAVNDADLAVQAIIKQSNKKVSEAEFENPLTTQAIFKDLASSEAFFVSEGGDSSIRTGGKSKWLYSYPSYVSTKVLEWKKDPSILEGLYESSANNKASHLMKWLLGKDINSSDPKTLSKTRLENFEIGVFTTLQETQGDSSAASDLSKNDYFIDHVNKVLANGFIRSITPADKTTDLQIKTGMRIKSFEGFRDGQVQLTYQAKEIMFGYFNGELNRMIEARNEIESFKNHPEKLTIHYHYKANKELYDKDGNVILKHLGNAFKSQLFEELSFKSGSKDVLVNQIQQLLYDENGFVKDFQGMNLSENPTGRIGDETFKIKDLIQEYINRELSKGIIQTVTTFREKGIFEVDDKGNTVNKLIDNKAYNNYDNNKALGAATDFYINSLIHNIEYTKMFTGDVAYYKNMVDFKKRVPATYTDGLQLRLKPGEETFKVATISSVEIPSPFLEELRKMLGDEGARKYGKIDGKGQNINAADAQAWITPKRWKFLVKGLGKWSPVHTSLYSKMIGTNTEAYTLEELKIAAQPLKGVYFDINGKTPMYLKYSQAVLTKNLITDSGLQKIYDQMNKKGYEVDELITLDGFKVGSPTPTTIHNEDGSLKDDFEFNITSLSNSGWKLQQDLPTKTFKETEVGSQIQKNIFGGLKFNKSNTFDFQGEEVTGQDLIDTITDITGKLSDMGLDSLKKEFGINKDGKIENIRGFYNSLISELEKRGGSKNVIEGLKKELVLYGVPQATTKVINVFSSIMNKRLVKIKTNGGSFIQMSNFGLNKDEANQKGVKWAPDSLSTTNEPIQYVDENGKVKTRPGGILISGSFIAKYIPNYRDIDSKDLFGYTNENGEFIEGMISKQILENIIGYRIPNQGIASNDALKIVGILPEENGDTVVAYTGITTKTGSDKY